jgi:hypothetical protein
MIAPLVFAVQGGEWGTSDLLSQRARATGCARRSIR